MAPPMSASGFLAALRAEGLTVVEVGDWRDHNRNHKGLWGPVHGVMIHHTVTKGTKATVDICRKGYTGLPGPLCHGVIAKDGTVYLVGYGRANHAGSGDGDVLRAVIAEQSSPADDEADTDGNRHFYGFECENLGDGKDPWPAAQLEAIEKAAAAVCRHHGWNEKSVLGHLEWQPGKVDPRGFTMASMRQRIHDRLEGPAKPRPPKEDDDMAITDADAAKIAEKVLRIDGVIKNPNSATAKANSHVALMTVVGNLEILARRNETRVIAQGAAIAELTRTVAQLAANSDSIDADALVERIVAAVESAVGDQEA